MALFRGRLYPYRRLREQGQLGDGVTGVPVREVGSAHAIDALLRAGQRCKIPRGQTLVRVVAIEKRFRKLHQQVILEAGVCDREEAQILVRKEDGHTCVSRRVGATVIEHPLTSSATSTKSAVSALRYLCRWW